MLKHLIKKALLLLFEFFFFINEGKKKVERAAESAKSTSPMPTKYPHFLKSFFSTQIDSSSTCPHSRRLPLPNHISTRWPGDWDIGEEKSANITTITPVVRKQVKPIDPVDGRPITPSRQHRPDQRFWSSHVILHDRLH